MLLCSDGSYYIGKTTNLAHRLRQHNGEIKGGAKYTAAKRPVAVAYTETFQTHREAAQREYVLKQLSHLEKEVLVKNGKQSA